jgi:starvation-inducible outer membrane lipoprotein
MPSGPRYKLIASALVWGLLAGCAARIPPQLAEQVSWKLSFPELCQQPEAYRGRVVALGGVVTHIDAVDAGYRVVVSEVPLDGSGRHRPAVEQPPRGKFIVLIPKHRFPRDLRPGTEVTVVGEVLGKGSLSGAESVAEVPLLDEQYTLVWGPSWWPRFMIGVWGGISI